MFKRVVLGGAAVLLIVFAIVRGDLRSFDDVVAATVYFLGAGLPFALYAMVTRSRRLVVGGGAVLAVLTVGFHTALFTATDFAALLMDAYLVLMWIAGVLIACIHLATRARHRDA